MTLAYAAERRIRPAVQGPLDYDDSLVPGKIVAGIMHLSEVTDREDRELGLALRWGYGSAFGVWHGLLHRRLREPWASAAFGATLMSATLSLFPLLGRTPPPLAQLELEAQRPELRSHRPLDRAFRLHMRLFRQLRPVA